MKKEKKSTDKFEGLNKFFEEAEQKKKSTLYPDNEGKKMAVSEMGKKKKSTLYPDNRKDFYSEFEDFLLINRQLIILIIIIVLFSFFIGCMLYIDYFRAEHTYNALKIIGGYYI